MLAITSAHRFRRRLCGVSLMLSPLLFAAAEMLAPASVSDAGRQLDLYAQHRTALLVSAHASIAVGACLLTGILGLVHLTRVRGVTWVHVGGLLAGYGLITAHVALGGVNLVFAEIAKPGLDRPAMLGLYHAVTHDPVVGAPLLLGHLTFVLGLCLLAIGLLRGAVGPRWAAVCVLMFPVSDLLLSAVRPDVIGEVVSNLFGIAGFAGLGLHLLRMSDDAWETGTAAEARAVPAGLPVPA